MEELIKRELGSKTLVQYGRGGGGCINTGLGYKTDTSAIFVKCNDGSNARRMFEGEAASLTAILNTGTINVPRPIKVIDQPKGGAALIMEYTDINSLSRQAAKAGEQMARLHLHNEEKKKRSEKDEGFVHKEEDSFVSQFGFDVATCCGYITQDNSWQDNWVAFYTRNKLQLQISLIEKKCGDREALELWPQLQRVIPTLFNDLDIKPALLHGDLWGGNIGENSNGPVIFDPASFYGHSEYELGICTMFGGFNSAFFSSYHNIIPKCDGFSNRNKLYQLFHYLNHWNHFGSGYRSQSISIMRQLSKLMT